MEIFSTIFIAIALAMDVFTVSISGGTLLKKIKPKDALTVGLYFGLFQAGMTFIGWKGGQLFRIIIEPFDHWVAFGLLLFIGGKMIHNSLKETEDIKFSLSHKILLLLAIATNIDAFGVGLSYAFLNKSLLFPLIIIGVTAFIFAIVGLYLGKLLKKILKNKAELIGGIILILIGLKIIYDHGVFNF